MNIQEDFNIVRAAAVFKSQPMPGERPYPFESYLSTNSAVPDFRVELHGPLDYYDHKTLIVTEQKGETSGTFMKFPIEVNDEGIVTGIESGEKIQLFYPRLLNEGYFIFYYTPETEGFRATIDRIARIKYGITPGALFDMVYDKAIGMSGFEPKLLESTTYARVPPVIDWMQTMQMYAEGKYTDGDGQALPLTADYIFSHPVVAAL